jgi:hypothetical protein
VRTQSSAERRITKELEMQMNAKTLMLETANFIHAERHIQEEVENARISASLAREMQARRRLFTQREPTAAMILTAAFLDAEIQSMEIIENARLNWHTQREKELYSKLRNQYNQVDCNYKDNGELNIRGCVLNRRVVVVTSSLDVLGFFFFFFFRIISFKINPSILAPNGNNGNAFAAQADNYERLKQLHTRDRLIGDPCDSSTPSKGSAPQPRTDLIQTDEPRQTIQQLAQLVMNSARWRNNNPPINPEFQRIDLNAQRGIGKVTFYLLPAFCGQKSN